jgi:hypothetical protein
MAGYVKVTGIERTIRQCATIAGDLNVMKDAMAKIAAMGAEAAIRYVPKRSGALAASIRGNRAMRKAVVTAGRGKTNQYASVINYGSPKRGIAARHFMQQASAELAPKMYPLLEENINRMIRERGLA